MILAQTQQNEQYSKTQVPYVGSYTYEDLSFDKEGKDTHLKKYIIFNKKHQSNWIAVCRSMIIDPYLSPYTKLKSKWIKDSNIRLETLNLIKEKIGNRLEHIGTRKDFLNRTCLAQVQRSAINKWDLMKIKSLCTAKRHHNLGELAAYRRGKDLYQLHI